MSIIVRGDDPRDHFTTVPNAALRDQRLSLRARGLLALLLSYPPGWKTDSTRLAAQATEGRDAVRAAQRELVAAGYMAREQVPGSRGRWTTVVTVYATPRQAPGQVVDSATEDGFSGVGRPGVGGPGAEVPKTEKLTEKKKIKPPLPPREAARRRRRGSGAGQTGGSDVQTTPSHALVAVEVPHPRVDDPRYRAAYEARREAVDRGDVHDAEPGSMPPWPPPPDVVHVPADLADLPGIGAALLALAPTVDRERLGMVEPWLRLAVRLYERDRRFSPTVDAAARVVLDRMGAWPPNVGSHLAVVAKRLGLERKSA